MIIYGLICEQGHHFEGWFTNVADMEDQRINGRISCPMCHSTQINKKLNVTIHGKKSNTTDRPEPGALTASTNAELAKQYASWKKQQDRLHDFLDQHFEDVGTRFSEEARMVHRGEREEPNIKGVATQEEIQELADEGIETFSIPPRMSRKEDYN